MQDVFAELKWRGLINQTTDDENMGKWLLKKPRTVYAGFDPTGDSLHVGHLMAVMVLRRFQVAGHRPIVVVGGATGMIGDPSGKSEERNLLDIETLRRNVVAMEKQLSAFMSFEGSPNAAIMVNNHDWMGKFGYLEFLRDVGKHFPIGVMLAKDSVKSRLARTDTGLSYTEFSYMLLQAYDFVQLRRQYDCEIQIGGSDQWGNITAGIDLARRMDGVQLYGMTCPLLATSDGRKMGKTESGAVWLDPAKTGPYHFYQYWINIDDQTTATCLRFFTDLDEPTINAILEEHAADPGQRVAQRRLAEEITRLVHGETGLEAAVRATQVFFGAAIEDLDDAQLVDIFADVPSEALPRDRLRGEGLSVIDAFHAAGLAKSKGEARRTISQGGAYVNNIRVENAERSLTEADLAGETVMILRGGKKRYALLRFFQ